MKLLKSYCNFIVSNVDLYSGFFFKIRKQFNSGNMSFRGQNVSNNIGEYIFLIYFVKILNQRTRLEIELHEFTEQHPESNSSNKFGPLKPFCEMDIRNLYHLTDIYDNVSLMVS